MKREKLFCDPSKSLKFKITFVDLAGSERVACINLTIPLYLEALFINESLKYLGFIVRRLAADQPVEELDFQQNLMTSLISDSIGGEALSLMFVCISPSFFDREATMDTMRFAAETGKIKKRPGALTHTKYELCTSKLYMPNYHNEIDEVVRVPANLDTMTDTQKANIRVTQIMTHQTDKKPICSLQIKLNNGEEGGFDFRGVDSTYSLPVGSKLTKIEHIFTDEEYFINNLLMWFDDGTHKQLGWDDFKGRVETFNLANNEHLIGIEIYHDKRFVLGLKWLTIREY